MDQIIRASGVAEIIGCTAQTARRIMQEMPLVNLSPAGSRKPHYGVRQRDLDRWLSKRTTAQVPVEETKPLNMKYPALKFR